MASLEDYLEEADILRKERREATSKVYRCGHFHAERAAAVYCVRAEDSWRGVFLRFTSNVALGKAAQAAASARVLFRRARRMELLG